MVWPLAVFPGFRGTRPITHISRLILPPMSFTMEPTSDTVSTMVAAAPTVVIGYGGGSFPAPMPDNWVPTKCGPRPLRDLLAAAGEHL
jgi:hypothetical protein